MPRISQENVIAREKLALELFMNNPELTASSANETISKRVPGGSMNHKRLYELRTKAQNALLKEGKIDKRPANKRGRRPGKTRSDVLSANRDVSLPEVEPLDLPPPRTMHEDAAALIKVDSPEQAQWLDSVLSQLAARGLANGKVVFTTGSHALIAGRSTH